MFNSRSRLEHVLIKKQQQHKRMVAIESFWDNAMLEHSKQFVGLTQFDLDEEI